ncbi:unnamed protein product [Adineta steineri]|uniref:G-protein coupled receptors family 1 profile domain-containing protein n=1 Tax=Adineta steineri TaxID=433720 RepID=A0A819U3W5_9BILA|nr:unnamed protein product [Adineta steineri]CAF4083101.1 unnamed protein product [Adineta steineri]
MSSSPYPSLVSTQQIFTRYGYPLIVVIGCLGNLLNIFLLRRKTLRTVSCNNYFLAASFVNLIILNVGIIPSIYVADRPWAITEAYCKIRSYLFNASQQMSRFMVVTACFDRFALCSTNVRLRQFSRVEIARRYMIPAIIIVWLIAPIYMLIFDTVINNSCTYIGTVALFNSIYGITLVGFTPPCLMFIFSLLTFRNLKTKQQRQQVFLSTLVNTQVTTVESRKQRRKNQQVLGMLMIEVVVYICTTTIASSNLLYSTLTTYLGISKSNERISIESFISFITNLLNYTCPCLSFYLFCFVSHLYRKQMILSLVNIRRQFSSLYTRNNNNTNSDEHISIRQMTAKVKPIKQPTMAPDPIIQ